jgi:exoribonuclease R
VAADIYVAARDLGDAQSGDEVQVRLSSRPRSGGQRCGIVEKVLKRASTRPLWEPGFEQERARLCADRRQHSSPIPILIADSGSRPSPGRQSRHRNAAIPLRTPAPAKLSSPRFSNT